MQQAAHLNHQPRALLDEVVPVPRDGLQRLIHFADRQRGEAVTIDVCMEDRFQIVVVGFGIGMQRPAIMIRCEGMPVISTATIVSVKPSARQASATNCVIARSPPEVKSQKGDIVLIKKLRMSPFFFFPPSGSRLTCFRAPHWDQTPLSPAAIRAETDTDISVRIPHQLLSPHQKARIKGVRSL